MIPVEIEDVHLRYTGFRLLDTVIRAARAIDAARDELTSAVVQIQEADAFTVPTEIKVELERMRMVLYANQIQVGDGGDMKAWDLMSVAIRLGEFIAKEDAK